MLPLNYHFCAAKVVSCLTKQNSLSTLLLPLYLSITLACNSTDGQKCISATTSDSGTPTAAIVSAVLIPLIVISAIIVIIVLLVIMYKCYNDFFYKYLCCCLYRASQFKVTTMQQEIQQLRHQLSQQKLSFSGRSPL